MERARDTTRSRKLSVRATSAPIRYCLLRCSARIAGSENVGKRQLHTLEPRNSPDCEDGDDRSAHDHDVELRAGLSQERPPKPFDHPHHGIEAIEKPPAIGDK